MALYGSSAWSHSCWGLLFVHLAMMGLVCLREPLCLLWGEGEGLCLGKGDEDWFYVVKGGGGL